MGDAAPYIYVFKSFFCQTPLPKYRTLSLLPCFFAFLQEQLGPRWCHFSPRILVDGTEGIPNGGGGQSDHSRSETRRVPSAEKPKVIW